MNKKGDGISYIGTGASNVKNGQWKVMKSDGTVPKGSVTAHVELLNKKAAGQIDFDDIEVTFK